MKTKTLNFILTLAVFAGTHAVLAQGTAFTYQGRLNIGGSPASGLYDYRFKLYSDPLGSMQVGSSYLTNAIPVTNGLFITTIDFGAGIFTGASFWLEVEVKTNGGASYALLTPLQAVSPTPYAIFAATASNVSGPVSAAQIAGGTIGNAVTLNNANNQLSGSFTGNGANVTNVNAATLNGLNSTNFWKLGGNNVAAGQFLGSTNNLPLELRVNGNRALRLEATASVPNIIGGFVSNLVDGGAQGVTIGGGGTTNFVNHVSSTLGTVAGGSGNIIGTNANDSTIGGGRENAILPSAWEAFIGGGFGHTIQTNSSYATIAGGGLNSAGYQATIAGGYFNTASGQGSFIGGGGDDVGGAGIWGNVASGSFSVIAGGQANYATGSFSLVGGGYSSEADGGGSVIGGGQRNYISVAGAFTTIAGGIGNQSTNAGATVGGGGFDGFTAAGNIAGGAASTIGGGLGNRSLATYAFNGGGVNNTVNPGANAAVISGGTHNLIGLNDAGSVIGGGTGNTIDVNSADATIGGGNGNSVRYGAYGATVPGGYNNFAWGNYSFAAGQQAEAYDNGAFVWSDDSAGPFYTTGPNQFLIRAVAGVGIGTNNPVAALEVASSTGLPQLRLDQQLNDYSRIRFAGYTNAVWDIAVQKTMNFWCSSYGNVLVLNPNGSASLAGTLSQGSDRNIKQDFAPVNALAVLAKVVALPISEWSYKADTEARHLGPMSQDFHATFNLNGGDDKHITTVDESGVALAAIQGLNQKLIEKDAKINELETRLNQLEQTLQSLTNRK